MTENERTIAVDETGSPGPRHPSGVTTLGSVAARSAATRRPADLSAAAAVTLEHVSVSFGRRVAVHDITLELPARQVTALVGPSGCGKTTVLRAINRLHDHTGGRVDGSIRIGDLDVYDRAPRRSSSAAGSAWSSSSRTPSRRCRSTTTSRGLRLNGIREGRASTSASSARCGTPRSGTRSRTGSRDAGVRLSGGQQQRLCIARALAIQPEVILMDEPCSALDPVATAEIEELIAELKREYTIVIVTHNMQQAARVADRAAVFLLGDDRVGELVETGPTAEVFTSPFDPRTTAYVEGRVG